jgi:hypothetical protein
MMTSRRIDSRKMTLASFFDAVILRCVWTDKVVVYDKSKNKTEEFAMNQPEVGLARNREREPMGGVAEADPDAEVLVLGRSRSRTARSESGGWGSSANTKLTKVRVDGK